jgi:predicted aconitase with swiveling domain
MVSVRLPISRTVISGRADGPLVATRQPLSLWGGLDPSSGVVIENGHELEGRSWAGSIFVYPEGRGSSTSAAVLVEAVRCGASPLAVINIRTDPVLVTGCIVSEILYGRRIPVVEVSAEVFGRLVAIAAEDTAAPVAAARRTVARGAAVHMDTDQGVVVLELDGAEEIHAQTL